MKERYIDLIEKTLEAYSREHIERYFAEVKTDGLTEHGFPRLTANMGILIAHGRKEELELLFVEMMDFCCENIPRVKAANDFSVKEIIFAIMELERLPRFSQKTNSWLGLLKTIDNRTCYNEIAQSKTDKKFNWVCFTAVSEFMRQHKGLCDSREFIDTQIATQLQWLDENGMYMDPGCPMVYDVVPRGLFAVLLFFGYDGEYRDAMDDCLKRTGLLTLRMQSVTGELPFGGRSNQFLHNEAHMAIILEYEARRYAKEGNMALASQFKAGVKLAIDSIEARLDQRPITHVKNRFPLSSGYGCEEYAYFDKYMITNASFLYVAYMICDDTVAADASERLKTDAFSLSAQFHRTFLRCGEYFAQLDTNAQMEYDCCGLGRIHKKGAPSELCMSGTCTAHPNYKTDREDAIDLSFCAGIRSGDEWIFATDSANYEIISISNDENGAFCTVSNTFPNKARTISEYLLTDDGLEVAVRAEGDVAYMLPAFLFDGESESEITCEKNKICVYYKGYACTYETDGEICALDGVGCNRNGYYKPFFAHGSEEIKIKISIEKNGH